MPAVERKYLLPPNLDQAERNREVERLVAETHRQTGSSGVLGYVLDVYPGEPDWVEQGGNRDAKRRVYYAVISVT